VFWVEIRHIVGHIFIEDHSLNSTNPFVIIRTVDSINFNALKTLKMHFKRAKVKNIIKIVIFIINLTNIYKYVII